MKIVLLLALLISSVSYGQNYQKEITDQVWISFIDSFNARDTKGFMAVHSKDVVRASRDANELLNFNEYMKRNQQGENQKNKRTLELRFTERIANENQAYEVGIYKTTSWGDKGESRSGYGKFHVVLRKEAGIWKILVDSDSSEGGSIGEKEFLAAKPL
jgi:ketosteroid isomerase-like protein